MTIEGFYRGNKKVRVVHGLSGRELVTDAPPDHKGEGTSFSPTDLVAAALGSCIMTILSILAERDGLNLDGMRVGVIKEMEGQPRRIASLAVTLHLPDHLAPEQRAKLERAAWSCPVAHSLNPEIVVDVDFVYDV